MLVQLGLLMMFQFVGQVLIAASGIPFPGSICGMVLLFVYLCWRGGPSKELTAVATMLVDNLGLLFVPAGTAIVAYGALLARDGLAIAAALLVSTVAAVLVSGMIAARGASVVQETEGAA